MSETGAEVVLADLDGDIAEAAAADLRGRGRSANAHRRDGDLVRGSGRGCGAPGHSPGPWGDWPRRGDRHGRSLEARHPDGLFWRAQGAAPILQFLASDAASLMTEAVVMVDSGLTLW